MERILFLIFLVFGAMLLGANIVVLLLGEGGPINWTAVTLLSLSVPFGFVAYAKDSR